MDIEKDLKIIERVALEKNDGNWEFLSFLKRHDYEIVFNVYEKLKDELWHYDELSEDDFYE
jgi:hypothetical protein